MPGQRLLIQAVRERAAERAKVEDAVDRGALDIQRSWSEIAEIETAIKERLRTAAEDLMARGARSLPSHVLAQLGDQILLAEPELSRELKAQLAHAEETLADRKQVRDELRAKLDQFESYDYAAQRAKQAAAEVIHDEAGDVIAQAVAAGEAAMLTLIKVRATLGWFQSRRVFGDLNRDLPQPIRDVFSPMQDALDRQFRAARASSAWSDVIDRLLADPTMPLPGVDTF